MPLALAIPAAIASGQNYKVETSKLLEVFGDVKVWSCGGGCCEGHDSTACVGVQVRDEDGTLLDTAIYDNASCCYAQCRERQECGPFSFIGISKDGPADTCPSNRSHFSAPVGKLNLCVAPGEVFRVPVRHAKLGNVVNNSWTSGSKCSERDPFQPFGNLDFGSRASWGGFTDTCPNPQNPDLVCVPSDCIPGDGGGSGAVPRYAAEIIQPYGNEYVTRWDDGDVWLQWRSVGRFRLDSYRIVVFASGGKLIDERVPCAADRCSHLAWFPLGAASYYWWVQPATATVTGEQSRAGVFNLLPPLTSCAGLGGSCVGSAEPGVPATCEGGAPLIDGALDCPQSCCAADCSSDQSHDHTGACGSTDVCGHVFGTPNDPGCLDDTPSCGELGGNYCSPTNSCPAGSLSLGTTRLGGAVECLTCCKQDPVPPTPPPGGLSCGEMGGDFCSQSSTCPFGYASLGFSYDCNPCCRQNSAPPTPTPSGLSCGEMGGDYCSQNGTCPGGFRSLGSSYDCKPCCKENTIPPTPTPSGPSCGAMGGDYCSQSGTCPSGYNTLGSSYDCNPCCKQKPVAPTPTPSGPSCGAMGGDYCSQSGTCPSGYNTLGSSYDCNPCCKQKPVAPTPTPRPAAPSCGAIGGDYCSQSGGCPGTHDSLGKSSDCNPCCVSKPSCGAMGGDYCSQGGSCPDGFSSLGRSVDCNPCCVSH
jgi:hypothetical protein